MEIYSICPGGTEHPYPEFRCRDRPITSQSLFSVNQIEEADPNQQIDSSCYYHAIQYLQSVEMVYVQQNIALLELALDIEACNTYQVLNSMGQKVFSALEESGCCVRCLCGPMRNFEMHLFDNLNNNVIRMHRHLACWRQRLELFCPTDVLVGYVEQELSWFRPKFGIFDRDGIKVMRIEGPYCQCKCCSDDDYQIIALTGEVIGVISKQWMGFLQEGFSDADSFRLEFPLHLDVNIKMVLLGAAFLIVRSFLVYAFRFERKITYLSKVQ